MVTKDSLTDLEGVTRVETPLGKSNTQKRKKLSKERKRENGREMLYFVIFFSPDTCPSDRTKHLSIRHGTNVQKPTFLFRRHLPSDLP